MAPHHHPGAVMKHHLLTAALLAAALGFYAGGLRDGGHALLALGGLCELGFWVRVVRRAG